MMTPGCDVVATGASPPAAIPPAEEMHARGTRELSLFARRKDAVLTKYLMVGIGGFLGSIARYAVGSYVGSRFGSRFPYGTFLINISGSFIIGMLIAVLEARTALSPNWRYLLPIGFVGAYTTFSTFEYETFRIMQDGDVLVAALNIVLSVAVGFAAVWSGITAGRAVS